MRRAAAERVPELAIWNPTRRLSACDRAWGAILDMGWPPSFAAEDR